MLGSPCHCLKCSAGPPNRRAVAGGCARHLEVLGSLISRTEYCCPIMTSTFRTLTVPLDGKSSPGGLPSFLVRDDVLCWTRREAGLVGFGEIARFTATGPERFLEADIWWRHLVLEAEITDSVELPGTGPVAFGSFAFSKMSAARIPADRARNRGGRPGRPRLAHPVNVRRRRAHRGGRPRRPGALAGSGSSRCGRPVAALARRPAAGCRRGRHLRCGPAKAGGAVVRPLPLAAGATLHTGSLSEEDWMAAVAAGVAEIRTGALEKLVLARDIVATIPDGRQCRRGAARAGRAVPRMLDVRRGRAGGRHAGDADPGGGPHCPGARAGRNAGPPRCARRGRPPHGLRRAGAGRIREAAARTRDRDPVADLAAGAVLRGHERARASRSSWSCPTCGTWRRT